MEIPPHDDISCCMRIHVTFHRIFIIGIREPGIKQPCEVNAKTLMRSVHENPFLVQIGFKEVIKLPGFKISQTYELTLRGHYNVLVYFEQGLYMSCMCFYTLNGVLINI